MNNKKNLISAIVFQVVTILYGLVLPRLILSTFGSEINGMTSSITQFLSFISLLEGGLGAVVLAELYGPIENNDAERIKRILGACQKFFSRLSLAFIIYTAVVAICYSISVKDKYEFWFTGSLVFILSISTLAQYLFAITNRLFLQASQKIYIINIVSSITLVVNLVIALIVIKVYPEIHLLKIGSSIAFLLQPVVFNIMTPKEYRLGIGSTKSNYVLKNRWSGFGQNLAHFINMNTDIAIITVLIGLKEVSVYSIYMLAINALRSLISSLDNSYQSALGKYYAEHNEEKLRSKFKSFEVMNSSITLILFLTCLMLINPFVSLYTKGVTDAVYYRPYFALVMVIANLLYCVREPYRILVLSAGKFQETNYAAIMEAGLNISISLILVNWLGLFGVAIGTLTAIVYRMIFFIVYLKKNVLMLEMKDTIISLLNLSMIILINIIAFFVININIETYYSFVLYGIITVLLESFLVGIIYVGPSKLVNLLNRK